MQFRGGMSELMRQAGRMQRKIEQLKEEIKDESSTGAVGDTGESHGHRRAETVPDRNRPRVSRRPRARDGADLIAAAVNAALKRRKRWSRQKSTR